MLIRWLNINTWKSLYKEEINSDTQNKKNVIFVGRKNKATLWKKGDIIDDTSFWNLSFEPSGIVNEIASANHF